MPDHSKPLWRTIADTLRDEIVADSHAGSDALPSDNQIARRFQVSRLTVIRAMHELERQNLIVRRKGAGNFLQHANNGGGRFVSTLVSEYLPRFYNGICAQIAECCTSYGLNLIWGKQAEYTCCNLNVDSQALIARYRKLGISGVFFVPTCDANKTTFEHSKALVRQLTEAGIAVIVFDREMARFPENGTYDFVGIDNMDAGYRQARHLIEQGSDNLCFLTPPVRLTSLDGRIFGFERALEDAGLPRRNRVIRCKFADIETAFGKLMSYGANGCCCCTDQYAAELLRIALANGIRVPQELKIIGLDDTIQARRATIPLSTIRQPLKLIAEEAVRLMSLRLNGDNQPPRRILVPTTLIVRESSAQRASRQFRTVLVNQKPSSRKRHDRPRHP